MSETDGEYGAHQDRFEGQSVRRDFAFHDEVTWTGHGYDLDGIAPKGVERAIRRFQHRKTSLVFNDAALEGNTFTEPEVHTLIGGRSVGGHTDHEADQIIALSEGSDLLLRRVRNGRFRLDKGMSDDLHRLIAQADALDAGLFRGEGGADGGGHVRAAGHDFTASAPGPGGVRLRQIYDNGLSRLSRIDDAVVRATAYSAFATYHQFYFDGNKRTARFMMNGELMSHGFDAIVVPKSREAEYHASLTEMFRTGELDPYIEFLVSCYDDRE